MVNQSESIAKLAAALVKAHAEMEHASKNASNPFYRSRYADLAEVINTTRPVLAKHGLSVVQFPGMQDGGVALDTVLIHESGEWMCATAGAPLAPKYGKDGKELPPDAQSVGSAVTYLRRYSLAAVCGITQEDDDGNAASHEPAHHEPHPEPKRDTPTHAHHDGDMIPCPRCGGAMWDNRTGKKNPKQPDLKCKDKECDYAIWLESWRDDLLRDIAGAHEAQAIDAKQRADAEEMVGSLVPSKLAKIQKRLDELAAQGALL